MSNASSAIESSSPVASVNEDVVEVILFDGVCNLCIGWVQFVIERDPRRRFRFAPLQSKAAQNLLHEETSSDRFDSIVLVRDGRIYTHSAAVLRIAKGLRFPWPLFAAFLIIPAPVRDLVYRFIARRRYDWFGRRETCMIPSPENRARFLE